MAERGWVRRSGPEKDRRSVSIEVTANGRAALERVARCAEAHLAEVLAPLDPLSQRRLQSGLGVLRHVFARTSTAARDQRRNARAR